MGYLRHEGGLVVNISNNMFSQSSLEHHYSTHPIISILNFLHETPHYDECCTIAYQSISQFTGELFYPFLQSFPHEVNGFKILYMQTFLQIKLYVLYHI